MSSPTLACKKKLHKCRPRPQTFEKVAAQLTSKVVRQVAADPASIECGVRQRLADKVSDNLVGLWLLVPEHLRLGTWDLVCGWSGQPSASLEPRVALQLIHEAALCTSGLRQRRYLATRGFELLNGLPFLASDLAVHQLLESHSVADSQHLQVALGKIRRASGHYTGKLLLLDPHRPRSYSRRHMRRHRKDSASKPYKTAQDFFCLDGDTQQPVCFTTSTSARTVNQATPELLQMAQDILAPAPQETLVAADTEHFTWELADYVHLQTPFDILTPIPNQRSVQRRLRKIPPETFTPHWAGYATAVLPYTFVHGASGPYYELVQRQGERPEEWHFNSFFSTTQREVVNALTGEYPKRWHAEEFFNFHQALGWQRGGTMNLHIRYGHGTMALLAQTVLHQLRTRLGEPFSHWDASHLANAVFHGLEGDVRVSGDTILVTYYNAPNAEQLSAHYTDLPRKLAAANVDPRIPWLYNFQLDFRFK